MNHCLQNTKKVVKYITMTVLIIVLTLLLLKIITYSGYWYTGEYSLYEIYRPAHKQIYNHL